MPECVRQIHIWAAGLDQTLKQIGTVSRRQHIFLPRAEACLNRIPRRCRRTFQTTVGERAPSLSPNSCVRLAYCPSNRNEVRPRKAVPFQDLVIEAEAFAVPVKQLQHVTSTATQREDRAAGRLLTQAHPVPEPRAHQFLRACRARRRPEPPPSVVQVRADAPSSPPPARLPFARGP